MKMNKTLIYAGVGAIAAYLLYKKFNANQKATEGGEVTDEQTDEQAEEQAEEGGGGAPSGGGGGGGASAPAPKPTDKPSLTKSGQVPSKGRPMVAKQIRTGARPNVRLGKPKPMASKPMRPTQGMSRPMARPVATPIPASKPVAKFAGFMDFDGLPDVQSELL